MRLTLPRSILEAFGCDADNSDPISGPYRPSHTLRNWVLFIVVVMLLGITVLIHFSFQIYVTEEMQRSARFEAAADEMCGKGLWFKTDERTVQCALKNGYKVGTAKQVRI